MGGLSTANKTTITKLFGESPIRPLREHMQVSNQAAIGLPAFFDAVIKANWARALIVQKSIVKAEKQADRLKKQLCLQLPAFQFLPVPRSDLIELLTMQDQIANRARDIVEVIYNRRVVIPEPLHASLRVFVATSTSVSAQVLTVIDEQDDLLDCGFCSREMIVINHLIEEMHRLERETDRLEKKLRSSLFRLESKLDPLEVIFLYQVIDWIRDLANCAQKVACRMQILLVQ